MLILGRRNTAIKRSPSIIANYPADALRMLKRQSSLGKRSSITTIKLFSADILPGTKLKDLIKNNLDSFYTFEKVFDKYMVHANPFDMSSQAVQDFANYASKFKEILDAAHLSLFKLQQKLDKYVNQQNVTEASAFTYICEQFLIKQQQVIQTIFESEKYICESKAEGEVLDRILEWNNMDIMYSYIFWKHHAMFETSDKPEHKKVSHRSVISGFKRFKQLIYFSNVLLVSQRPQYQNLVSAFESLQTYAVKAYDILVRKVEQIPDVAKKYMEILETLRNMSKDFVSGDFSANRPFIDLNRRATEFFNRLNNANDTFKFFEEEMEAKLMDRNVKTPSVSRVSFNFDLSEDSKVADPLLDLLKNQQESSEGSQDESEGSDEKSKESAPPDTEDTGGGNLFDEFMQTDFYRKYVSSQNLDKQLVNYMAVSPDNPQRSDIPYLYDPEEKKESDDVLTESQPKSSMPALFGDVNAVFELFRPPAGKKTVITTVSKLMDILDEPTGLKCSSLDPEDRSASRLEKLEKEKVELEEKLRSLQEESMPRLKSYSVLGPRRVLRDDSLLHPI